MLLAIIIGFYVLGWFFTTVGFCVNEDLEDRLVNSETVAGAAAVALFWPFVVVVLVVCELPSRIITGLSSFIANRIRAFKRSKVKLTKG